MGKLPNWVNKLVEWSNWVRHGKSRYKEPLKIPSSAVVEKAKEIDNVVGD